MIVSLRKFKQFYSDELVTRVLSAEVTMPKQFHQVMIVSIMEKTNMEQLYESVGKKKKFSPFDKRYAHILV